MSLQESDFEANPDVWVPDWIEGTATKIDGWGLWVLVCSGECRCGYWDWGIAPDWKVPAEWGGGYMTDQCPECLGTVEYDDEWELIHNVVSEYRELDPRECDTDP